MSLHLFLTFILILLLYCHFTSASLITSNSYSHFSAFFYLHAKTPISFPLILLLVLTATKLNSDCLLPHPLCFIELLAKQQLCCQMQMPHRHHSEAAVLSVEENIAELLQFKTMPDHSNCLPLKKCMDQKTTHNQAILFFKNGIYFFFLLTQVWSSYHFPIEVTAEQQEVQMKEDWNPYTCGHS